MVFFGNFNDFNFYKVATKNLLLASFILFAICYIASFMSFALGRTIASTMYVVGWIQMFLVSNVLLFSVNLNMAQIISSSFDFWFKMVNIVAITVAIVNIRIYRYKVGFYGRINLNAYIIILAICEFSGFLLIFFLDGTLISQNITWRRVITCSFALLLLFSCIWDFFFLNQDNDQLNWNPFKSRENDIGKYTNVNFKSLYASAAVNISIFLMKPMFGAAAKKIKQSICNGHSSTNDDNTPSSNHNNVNLIPTYSMYKKPHFCWHLHTGSHGQNKA